MFQNQYYEHIVYHKLYFHNLYSSFQANENNIDLPVLSSNNSTVVDILLQSNDFRPESHTYNNSHQYAHHNTKVPISYIELTMLYVDHYFL